MRTKKQIEAGMKNLKTFPKGVSGNPAGKPPIPEWLKEEKRLPKHVAARLWSKWLSMKAEDLKTYKDDWSLSALELGMCRALFQDIEHGRFDNFEKALSRVCGKVTEEAPGEDSEDLSKLPPEEIRARVQKAIKVLEMQKDSDGSFTADAFDYQGVHK